MHKTKHKNTSNKSHPWHLQTLCWVKNAEEIQDGVVDISWAQESQTPCDPEKAGESDHGGGISASQPWPVWSGHHAADANSHDQQDTRVDDEHQADAHHISCIEVGTVHDPAAVETEHEVAKGTSWTSPWRVGAYCCFKFELKAELKV